MENGVSFIDFFLAKCILWHMKEFLKITLHLHIGSGRYWDGNA